MGWSFYNQPKDYPLVICCIAMENGPFIDVLPIKMVIFNSYVNVYQRISLISRPTISGLKAQNDDRLQELSWIHGNLELLMPNSRILLE